MNMRVFSSLVNASSNNGIACYSLPPLFSTGSILSGEESSVNGKPLAFSLSLNLLLGTEVDDDNQYLAGLQEVRFSCKSSHSKQ